MELLAGYAPRLPNLRSRPGSGRVSGGHRLFPSAVDRDRYLEGLSPHAAVVTAEPHRGGAAHRPGIVHSGLDMAAAAADLGATGARLCGGQPGRPASRRPRGGRRRVGTRRRRAACVRLAPWINTPDDARHRLRRSPRADGSHCWRGVSRCRTRSTVRSGLRPGGAWRARRARRLGGGHGPWAGPTARRVVAARRSAEVAGRRTGWAASARPAWSARRLSTPSAFSSMPAHHQRRAGAGHPPVALPQPRRADDVEHAGLVLEVDERDAARGRRPLPVGDDAADAAPAARARSGAAARSAARRPRSSWSRTNCAGCASGRQAGGPHVGHQPLDLVHAGQRRRGRCR